MGSWVNAYDHGRFLGKYRVGDTSYKSPGQANRDTVEFRDRKVDSRDISLAPVTINYSPNIQAVDSAGIHRVLHNHIDAIVSAIHSRQRDALSSAAVV